MYLIDLCSAVQGDETMMSILHTLGEVTKVSFSSCLSINFFVVMCNWTMLSDISISPALSPLVLIENECCCQWKSCGWVALETGVCFCRNGVWRTWQHRGFFVPYGGEAAPAQLSASCPRASGYRSSAQLCSCIHGAALRTGPSSRMSFKTPPASGKVIFLVSEAGESFESVMSTKGVRKR